jgi:hypothetical protein
VVIVVVELVVVDPPSGFTQRDETHKSPGSQAPPAVHAQVSFPIVHELLLDEEHAVIHAKQTESENKLAPTKCLLSMGTPIFASGGPESQPKAVKVRGQTPTPNPAPCPFAYPMDLSRARRHDAKTPRSRQDFCGFRTSGRSH